MRLTVTSALIGAVSAGLMVFFSVAQATETKTYTYDALGRLVSQVSSGTVNPNDSRTYCYDAAGNRMRVASNETGSIASCTGDVLQAQLTVGDATVAEGGTLSFLVTRAGNTSVAASASYTTANGTAVAPGDYTSAANTVSFAANEASKTIEVITIDDTALESSETLTITLSSPSSGVTIIDGIGAGTIIDNDSAPTLSVFPASAIEGSSLIFNVTRTGSPSASVSVNYSTSSGTATAGANFVATSGILSFPSGVTTQSVAVATLNDNVSGADLTMTINLSLPSSPALIGAGSAAGTIVNADMQPTFSISSALANEYAQPLVFTVTRSGASGNAVTVNYATSNGTAIAGTNFAAASGTLTFGPGVSFQSITVPTTSDLTYTSNLAMTVSLSSPSLGTLIGNGSGTGTISNTDTAPTFSIGGAIANEGLPLIFNITRSGASGNSVSVNYATANGTAVSGTNYTAASGTLNFASGVTSQSVAVPTIADNAVTGDLTMTLSLSLPSSPAALGTASAAGSILNTTTVGTPTIPGNYVMVAGAVNPGTSGYNDGTVGVGGGSGSSLAPSSIGGGYMISSVRGAGNRSAEASFTIASTANGPAMTNSGWTSITIPGVGAKTRSSAVYTTFVDSLGRQTAKWAWTASSFATSGTVVIQ